MHYELAQRRPRQVRSLLEGVLHVLRHPGRNPAALSRGLHEATCRGCQRQSRWLLESVQVAQIGVGVSVRVRFWVRVDV